jgi:hypothetical protein
MAKQEASGKTKRFAQDLRFARLSQIRERSGFLIKLCEVTYVGVIQISRIDFWNLEKSCVARNPKAISLTCAFPLQPRQSPSQQWRSRHYRCVRSGLTAAD